MSWMWTNSNQVLDVLLVVTDGKLQVTGNDTLLLVITSGIARQLKNFGSKILKDSSEIDCATRTRRNLGQSHGLRPLIRVDAPGAPAPTR